MDLSMPAGTPATTANITLCPICHEPTGSSQHQCKPQVTLPATDELFTAAYREYRAMVRWTIVDKLGGRNLDLADDLTQETFLRLFRYRERVDFGPRVAGLLKVMAKQSVGHHYRLMRNTREVPADTGHWSTANREMEPARGGYYTPAATGFRTAQLGGAR